MGRCTLQVPWDGSVILFVRIGSFTGWEVGSDVEVEPSEVEPSDVEVEPSCGEETP